MFQYISMDYIVDNISGVSTPLPDVWQIENHRDSSDAFSNIKITKQDVNPHASAIKILSNPINLTNEYGVQITTR